MTSESTQQELEANDASPVHFRSDARTDADGYRITDRQNEVGIIEVFELRSQCRDQWLERDADLVRLYQHFDVAID